MIGNILFSFFLLLAFILFGTLYVVTMLRNAKLAAENEDLRSQLAGRPDAKTKVFRKTYTLTESDLMGSKAREHSVAARRLVHSIADDIKREHYYEMTKESEGDRDYYTMTIIVMKDE